MKIHLVLLIEIVSLFLEFKYFLVSNPIPFEPPRINV